MHQSRDTAVLWAVLISLAFLAASALAGPLDSCSAQAGCFNSTLTLVSGGQSGCTTAPCQYRFCLKMLSSSSSCPSSISHTCPKVNTACTPNNQADFSMVSKEVAVNSGDTICQYGAGGSTLYFLLKDGNTCGDSGSFTLGGSRMACQPRPSTINSCTGNGVGVECIWSVTLPSCSAVANPSPSRSPSPAPGKIAVPASPSKSPSPSTSRLPVPITPTEVPNPSPSQCAAYEDMWASNVVFEAKGGACGIDNVWDIISGYRCARIGGCNLVKCEDEVPQIVLDRLVSDYSC